MLGGGGGVSGVGEGEWDKTYSRGRVFAKDEINVPLALSAFRDNRGRVKTLGRLKQR